jgi:hypothetical protein
VEVPIKLWVKYMPETIDRLIRDIYDVPSDSSFDTSEKDLSLPDFSLPTDHAPQA